MKTSLSGLSSAPANGVVKNDALTAQRAPVNARTLRALAAPIIVVGLEWIVSGSNKIIGDFVRPFPAYASALQAQHTFLPGLSLIVRFPVLTAWLVILTESGLGIALILTAFFFLRGVSRVWEMVGSIALVISTFFSAGIGLSIGRPPFWPDGNGYGSGWPVEFFLITISASLAIAIAFADPDETIFMRARRSLRRWSEAAASKG